MFPDTLIAGLAMGLAVAGVTAIVVRIVRSTGRILLASAGVAAARSGADASARRGDVTGMREAKVAEKRARSALVKAIAAGAAWMFWLVSPIPFDLAPGAYAAAAILWFLPAPRPNPAGNEPPDPSSS